MRWRRIDECSVGNKLFSYFGNWWSTRREENRYGLNWIICSGWGHCRAGITSRSSSGPLLLIRSGPKPPSWVVRADESEILGTNWWNHSGVSWPHELFWKCSLRYIKVQLWLLTVFPSISEYSITTSYTYHNDRLWRNLPPRRAGPQLLPS